MIDTRTPARHARGALALAALAAVALATAMMQHGTHVEVAAIAERAAAC